MEKFDSADVFKAADTSRKLGVPYIVENCDELNKIVADKAAKTTLLVFQVQFPNSEMAKSENRGQIPFHNDKKTKVREHLMEFAPQAARSMLEKYDTGGITGKTICQVSLFGCTPQMVHEGIERNGLPSLRYHKQGVREVTVVMFSDILEYMKDHSHSIPDAQDFFEGVKDLLTGLRTKEDFDIYFNNGARKIYRGVVKEGACIYIPAGCFVVERTLGECHVYGFRTSALDPTPRALHGWNCLRTLVMERTTKNEGLVKLWSACADILKPHIEKLLV